MENATKALIISATVLIVIVLIAIGISLLGSTSKTSESATETGDAISNKTDEVADSLKDKLNENITSNMDETSFNQYIRSKYEGTKSGTAVLELCRLLKNRYGSVHKDHTVTHVTCSNSYAIRHSNVETSVKKGKQYNVTFTGSVTSYSIKIQEV